MPDFLKKPLIFAPKEALICESVISMIIEGHEVDSIKVSDIASRADIGKGTVYEYFSSKEEIFSKALLYSFSKAFDDLKGILDESIDFKSKFFRFFQKAALYAKGGNNICQLFVCGKLSFDLHKTLLSFVQDDSYVRKSIHTVCSSLLRGAVDEGIVEEPPYEMYWISALYGSLNGIMVYLRNQNLHPEVSLDEIIQFNYNMLVRSMNQIA